MKLETFYQPAKTDPIFKDGKDRQMAYTQVFKGSDVGSKVLEDLLWECGLGRTAFNNSSDSQTYFNLGKQNLGFHILNLLGCKLERKERRVTDD